MTDSNAGRYFRWIRRDKRALQTQSARTRKGCLIEVEASLLRPRHVFREGVFTNSNAAALVDVVIGSSVMPNCNISSGRASSAIRIRNSCVVTNGDIICFCGLRAGTISDTVTAAEGGISKPKPELWQKTKQQR